MLVSAWARLLQVGTGIKEVQQPQEEKGQLSLPGRGTRRRITSYISSVQPASLQSLRLLVRPQRGFVFHFTLAGESQQPIPSYPTPVLVKPAFPPLPRNRQIKDTLHLTLDFISVISTCLEHYCSLSTISV